MFRVNDKMAENQNMYNVEEAQAVLRNISELSKSLVCSEKEKQDLLLVSRRDFSRHLTLSSCD